MTTEAAIPEETPAAAEEPMPPADQEPPAEATETIRSAAKALQELLAREPTARQDIAEIFKEHLQQPLTADTANTLFNSMSIYAGDEETSDLVLGVLTRSVNDQEIRELFEGGLDDKTRSWVRALLASHGARLREAWVIGGENPNSWRSVNRSVLLDPGTGDWQLGFEIVTYSGERLKLEETPTTLLLLASAILDTLNRLPEEVAPEALAPDRRDEFMEIMLEFVRHFVPASLWEEGDEVETDEEGVEPPL